MKSLPTKYKGYNFRSRTEARWAVFFDAMRITYLYEHEDVVLPSGRRYLPDFYLPNFAGGKYCEVKGKFTKEDLLTCFELAALGGKGIILLEGVPDFKTYYTISYHEPARSIFEGEPDIYEGIFCASFSKYGERMFVEPGFSTFEPNDWYSEYKHAVYEARGAQFEFITH
jgi:hypothetical protein